MEYRNFGRLDLKVSALGYGCMRLPVIDGDPGRIDESQATDLVRYAVDHGVNYVDTAYPYHQGNSERFLGRALKDGYREKVNLATKLPVWEVKEYADFDRLLNEQLDRLQTDYIDFYLLHALDKERWQAVKELGVLDWLDQQVAAGKIKHPGFSFHDSLDVFKEIVDAYDWHMCQIQLNYMDQEYQAGVAGLKYAGSKGIAVVIMEPLRGGKLAKNVPSDVKAVFDATGIDRTPAAWALRWLWNFPEVSVVLSGMGSMEEVKENIESAADARPGSLTEDELATIEKAREIYNRRIKVSCTECEYCQPCPNDVAIPRIFRLYNELSMYETNDAKHSYQGLVKDKKDAANCIECGQCESVCPQHIPIIETLKEADKALTA